MPVPAIAAPARANPAPHRTGAPPRGPARDAGPGNGRHNGRRAGPDRGDRARRNPDGRLGPEQEPGRDGGSCPDPGQDDQAWVNDHGHPGEPLSGARQGHVNGDGSPQGHSGLEGDDLRLLTLLAGGLPANAVARKMNLSPRTLRRRTRSLCDKIGVHTPIEAVAWAARRLLI